MSFSLTMSLNRPCLRNQFIELHVEVTRSATGLVHWHLRRRLRKMRKVTADN